MRNGTHLPSALLLAIGLALAGWFVGDGFRSGRATDRYVTVKGLSEREVTADLALWPIRYTATDDQLSRAQAAIEQNRQAVVDFLTGHGIAADRVEVQKLDVNDLLANPYGGNAPVRSRYIVTQTLMVRTDDPATVQKAAQDVGRLVDAGVVLQSEGYGGGGPTYLYTRLNDLKPEMIAEATAEARRAAEQFARDSGSRIGRIRQANQGVFQILPRDRAPGIVEEMQPEKTVRVVSTVEYYLRD